MIKRWKQQTDHGRIQVSSLLLADDGYNLPSIAFRFAFNCPMLLDFCCGRGGDIMKWFAFGVRPAAALHLGLKAEPHNQVVVSRAGTWTLPGCKVREWVGEARVPPVCLTKTTLLLTVPGLARRRRCATPRGWTSQMERCTKRRSASLSRSGSQVRHAQAPLAPPAIHHLMSKATGWLTTTGCLDEVGQCFKWLAACGQAGLGAHRFQLTAAPWPVACRLCAQAAAL